MKATKQTRNSKLYPLITTLTIKTPNLNPSTTKPDAACPKSTKSNPTTNSIAAVASST